MGSRDDRDTMADALLEAGRLVKVHGSADLQAAMRMALFILGREIAEREAGQRQHGGRPTTAIDPFARIIGKRQD